MGRKQALQFDLQIPEGPPARAPDPQPVRRPRAKPEPDRPWVRRIRMVLTGGTLLAAAVVFGAALYQLDGFLARGSQFVLAGSPESPGNLEIQGLANAPRGAVLYVFRDDFGRSIYLMALEARRRDLLNTDWVREATIERRWPNRVLVRIVEREPVAFVLLPEESPALIDTEGVILQPPERVRLNLPVLRGLTRQQPAAARQQRMQQVQELIREAEAYAGQISEIDAGDPENLQVTQSMPGGRVVRLMLGNERYRARLNNFLNHYPDISRRLPAAAVFDLRLDDRITASGPVESAKAAPAQRPRAARQGVRRGAKNVR